MAQIYIVGLWASELYFVAHLCGFGRQKYNFVAQIIFLRDFGRRNYISWRICEVFGRQKYDFVAQIIFARLWASKIIFRGPCMRFWASKIVFRGPNNFVGLWASK